MLHATSSMLQRRAVMYSAPSPRGTRRSFMTFPSSSTYDGFQAAWTMLGPMIAYLEMLGAVVCCQPEKNTSAQAGWLKASN